MGCYGGVFSLMVLGKLCENQITSEFCLLVFLMLYDMFSDILDVISFAVLQCVWEVFYVEEKLIRLCPMH